MTVTPIVALDMADLPSALVAFSGLVRAAGRPLTWLAIGTLLALAHRGAEN